MAIGSIQNPFRLQQENRKANHHSKRASSYRGVGQRQRDYVNMECLKLTISLSKPFRLGSLVSHCGFYYEPRRRIYHHFRRNLARAHDAGVKLFVFVLCTGKKSRKEIMISLYYFQMLLNTLLDFIEGK